MNRPRISVAGSLDGPPGGLEQLHGQEAEIAWGLWRKKWDTSKISEALLCSEHRVFNYLRARRELELKKR